MNTAAVDTLVVAGNSIAAKTDVAKEIFSRIDAIAAKLGVAANHFWPIYVKQVSVEAYSAIALLAVGLLIGSLFWIRAATLKGCYFDCSDPTGKGVIAIAGTVVLIIATLVLFINGADIAGKLANPEYYAMNNILHAIKP